MGLFAAEHPETFSNWHSKHKNLINLSVDNEQQLLDLWLHAKASRIETSGFTEPDINNELTAVALAPHPETYAMTSSFDLALKEYDAVFALQRSG